MALLRANQSHTPPTEPPATTTTPAPTLDDLDPAMRRAALRALPPDDTSVDALRGRLLLEQDPHVRSVLITCLVEVGSITAATALADLLACEDVALRNLAIIALGEIPESALQVLPTYLASDDPDVRIFATTVLGAIGGPKAATLLAYLLVHDPNVNVVDAAINGLAEVGGREHIGALQTAHRRFASAPYIGFAVKAAIAALSNTPLSH